MPHSATTFLKVFASTVLIGAGGLLAYQILGSLGSLTSFGLLLFAAVLTVVTALLLRG